MENKERHSFLTWFFFWQLFFFWEKRSETHFFFFFGFSLKLIMQDCLANDFFDNVDKSPKQKLCTTTDESEDALSNYSVTTTKSDHRELWRLIKRRKQDKFKADRMMQSAKEYQKKKLSAELLQDTISSDDDTTEMKTKKSEGNSDTMLKHKEDNNIEVIKWKSIALGFLQNQITIL
jgi:hypothetical protein